MICVYNFCLIQTQEEFKKWNNGAFDKHLIKNSFYSLFRNLMNRMIYESS